MMKQVQRLFSHMISPLVMIAGLMLATFGMACQEAKDAPEPNDDERRMNTPHAATAQEQGHEDPGFSDDHVLFGQSAAFTGPARELGKAMRLGIEAAFHEANQDGGVHGRVLKLKALDDGYETDFAATNTQRLIENESVFALIGAVGTPTSRAAYPLAQDAGVPFLAPFTGAEFLRDPELNNVLNVRASYYQETDEMVARLTEDLGITRVAVLYQEDSFGLNGLEGARLALERRGLEPVAASHYPRNTRAVRGAVFKITAANPEAVILIGSYKPVVKTIELVRRELNPVFMTVSFVGSNALANELGPEGAGVYVTQVVPLPHDENIPVVARYQNALSGFDPQAEPGFVSLEGYLAGRFAVAGLRACGTDLSREGLLKAVRDAGVIEIDGMPLEYGPEDNQGSDAVFLTVIGTDGQYHGVEKLKRP
ncbi:MAG: ABC transporter substrate-binding protein [Gemmatimonadota bacterium]|nr:ABC transporter substrate-binding protein [Gemmatimonadota bacterium]